MQNDNFIFKYLLIHTFFIIYLFHLIISDFYVTMQLERNQIIKIE
jgi:hypothetical protein